MSTSEKSAFNKSGTMNRTPPSSHAGSQRDKVTAAKNKITKTTVPCNHCEKSDEHTKVVCCKCQRWWHVKCLGKQTTQKDINQGTCLCEGCRAKPTEIIDLDESKKPSDQIQSGSFHKTTVLKPVERESQEVEEGPSGLTQRLDKTEKESTHYNIHAKSKSSRNSISSRERLRMIEEVEAAEMAEMQIRLEMAVKKKEFAKQKQAVLEASVHGSKSSKAGSVRNEEAIRRDSIEKCTEWFEKRVSFEKTSPHNQDLSSKKERKSGGLLSTNVSTKEFLDETLGATVPLEEIELTTKQLKARQVISKELPEFSGDPKEWPLFIATFGASTQQCGFSDHENLSRLTRCLKGEALEAVRADLMTPLTLPSALSTLKLLYGRPDVIFDSLVNLVRQAPRIYADRLETIIPFALRVKTMCDTAKMSGMSHNLHNTALLNELLEKLPSILRLLWGERCRTQGTIDANGNINQFDEWVREIAESASIGTPKYAVVNQKTQPSSSRHVKKDMFQGVQYEEQEKLTCQMCSAGNHTINNCSVFQNTSVPKRWATVKDKKLCVSCLGKHFIAQCTEKKLCTREGCKQPHHPLLHSTASEQSESKTAKQCTSCKGTGQQLRSKPNEDVPSKEQESSHMGVHTQQARISFQIVPVVLSNGEGSLVETFAFLDNGSEVTLIEEDIVSKLRVSGPKKELCMKWTGDVKRTEANSRIVQLQIADVSMTCLYPLKNAHTVKELGLPKQSLESSVIEHYEHLRTMKLPIYQNVRPKVLIGLDNIQLMTAQETREGQWDEPVAVRTRLGWTVLGRANYSDKDEPFINMHQQSNEGLEQIMKNFFSFENMGVVIPKHAVESNEDRRARKLMTEQLNYCQDGRYEVGLLWRQDDVSLPDSYGMAMRRAMCLEKKMSRNAELKTEMKRQMQEYIDQGFLNMVKDSEVREVNRRVWYLPMFTVLNPNKPGKMRIVWDAAAEVNGQSLNSHLLTGPDLLTNLVGVLYKFRERKYAISGDIRQMFHQIKVRTNDQDAQRCLWRFNEAEPMNIYKMSVMTFGAACSPCLAQFVKNTHASKYQEQYPRAVEAILERHYVDDFIDSFDSAQECIEVTRQVINIHRLGGFHIRGFASNAKHVLSHLSSEDEQPQKCIIEHDDMGTKILGMWWDTVRDTLTYKLNHARIEEILKPQNVKTPTKRMILRMVMSVFDSMGLIGYFVVLGKLVMKDIWRTSTDWDEGVKPAEENKWKLWLSALSHISEFSVPRWYFTETLSKAIDLHIFVDASEEAIAAVAYFVQELEDCRRSQIIASKTKVAPNKTISVPRLELQAAVLGARLANVVRTAHSVKISRTCYWTDSRNVICWLRSPRRFKTFVAHRIGEIRETTSVGEWRWVPTDQNIADAATKWRVPQSCPPTNWIEGPSFIKEDDGGWPEEPLNIPQVDEYELEARCNVTQLMITDGLRPDLSRFSNFNRLVNTQAYVLRFFYQRGDKSAAISPEEVKQAVDYLVRSVQREVFQKELKALHQGLSISKDSRLRTYSPFIDEHGVMRMRSRLENAEYLTFDQRCPIILPKIHKLTDLIVEREHRRYKHQNHATVMNELKQLYVIPGLRARIKTIRNRCRMCQIYRAEPQMPEMAALPRSRLAAQMRPFTYTGVDLFGPMTVKHGRKSEKKWGVIFTCLTTRAIHLELVSALSTDSFILALQCFIGRRGSPKEIFSDNGTNFRGADN